MKKYLFIIFILSICSTGWIYTYVNLKRCKEWQREPAIEYLHLVRKEEILLDLIDWLKTKKIYNKAMTAIGLTKDKRGNFMIYKEIE